jgi:predicted dehydrogenase
MLKIGVVGTGHLGKIHLQNLLLLKDEFELVGFFDTDPSIQSEVAQQFSLQAYASYEDLLAASEVILLACPTAAHFSMAVQALKKRKHLFIEKPVCQTVEESKSLLTYGQEAGVVVQVGHVERFNPAFIAAKGQIDMPMFIESHRLAPFQERGSDVSVVLDLMIHDIDIALKVVNSRVKRISASGMEVLSSTTDIASVRLEFENGCVANLTSSRIAKHRLRKTRFFMSDHSITVDFLAKTAEKSHVQLNETTGFKTLKYEPIPTEDLNAIQLELKAFAQSISTEEKAIVGLEEAHHAMEVASYILDRISESNQFVK